MEEAGIFFISLIISPLIVSFIIAFSGPKKADIPGIELNVRKKQRFERIRWIFNEQLPANDCPVMFLRGAVLKDKTTGKNLLQLKFINSGTQTIKSAYAAIDFIDDAGDIIANGITIQAEYLDVNCASGDTFGQKQLLDLGDIGAIHIVITYNKVVFTDGTVWRAGTDSQVSRPIPVTLLKSVLPPELQNEVSEETLCKPETLGGGLWRCTCGCLVRTADGDTCPNCQQTFEQAQETASVIVLEKRNRERIAEQEQAALDKQVAKKQAKSYVSQFIFSVVALYLGAVIGYVSLALVFEQGLRILEAFWTIIIFLYFFAYFLCGCISMLMTAILLRKARKDGAIKDAKSARTVIKIQGITALAAAAPYVFGCLMTPVMMLLDIFENYRSYYWTNGFNGVGSFVLILMIVASAICLIPNFLYWYRIPYIRSWLSKQKNLKEKIALAICGIFVVIAVAYIAQIPSAIHYSFWGGFTFDSEIVLPCIISIALAAGSIFVCRRFPIVKGWLEKLKSKKREK